MNSGHIPYSISTSHLNFDEPGLRIDVVEFGEPSEWSGTTLGGWSAGRCDVHLSSGSTVWANRSHVGRVRTEKGMQVVDEQTGILHHGGAVEPSARRPGLLRSDLLKGIRLDLPNLHRSHLHEYTVVCEDCRYLAELVPVGTGEFQRSSERSRLARKGGGDVWKHAKVAGFFVDKT